MTEVSIRRLEPADLMLARRLNALFGSAFDDAETYGSMPPDDIYLAALLGRPHVVVLSAIRSDDVVGGLVAYELEKFEQARSEFYIYDLAVAEPYRRQGIATRLISTLKRIAAARGASVLFVQADHGDDPAIALYQKLGTREDVMHFDIGV